VGIQQEETDNERITRNVNELLQELRVAQAGVQILFGFLLSITFTEVYTRATGFQKGTHLVTVLFATAAVALLTAPAAWHRLLFRLGQRPMIVQVANTLAVLGLASLAAAMTGTVLLLTNVVLGSWLSVPISLVAAAGFASLWFLVPWRVRQRAEG
jgi:Family of unknown function (DUF6328)